ncbi:hypothetical protein J42TS3_26320 [Paenibacillus vini]|uniref:Uncharacterized protein n=1 Tax=Paenibacillus vini TaxID=1476024 RepID=A0ABQ4MC77_9BACL|nr:hypothetical protein J42TS3_26320 [Paenibacillus vini]
MGLEHELLNQMPWYHKLWFIPVDVVIVYCVIEVWNYSKSILGR